MAQWHDVAQSIIAYFPDAPYALGTPYRLGGSDLALGPLKALFSGAGDSIERFRTNAIFLLAQSTVQNATGLYLDHHGFFYGLTRLPSEVGNDEAFRVRILGAMTIGRLTIPAILAQTTAYYNAVYPLGSRPIIDVYDLQSDPPQAAKDVYTDPGGVTHVGLQNNTLVIGLEWPQPNRFFFAGRSRLGRGTFACSLSAIYGFVPNDPVALVIERNKAGGVLPVFKQSRLLIGGS